METPSLLLYVASWLGFAGGIWGLFALAEETLKPEAKEAVSRWLQNVDASAAVSNWPSTFATVFDRVFGERHLSLKCFGRSCLASFVSVAVVTLIWAGIDTGDFTAFLQKGRFGAPLRLLIVSVILNVIPDYLSLLESRHVIKWMCRTSSSMATVWLLVFDLAVTAAIFLVYLWALQVVVFLLQMGRWEPLGALELAVEFWSDMLRLSVPGYGDPTTGIWFYSTFFTSVWLWLYALSGLVVKLAKYVGISVRCLKTVLDIDEKPLRCMGMVAVLLVAFIYVVAAPFLL